jgi:PAS domain S-box-containing protein
MNPVAETLTGWRQTEATGRPLGEVYCIVDEHTHAAIEDPIAKVFEQAAVPGPVNHTILVGRDGRELPIEDCAAPIRDDKGDFTGVVLVFHDVTERKRLEQQFAQAQRMEAIGRLAGGVAHDFNNLMTTVLGYSDLLLHGLLPGHPMRENLEEIKKTAERAASLTRQLLTFSRKQPLRTRVLDLNQVVAGTEKMLRRLIGEDIALETTLTPDSWPVQADPGQIEQVIMNLAVNARDAMPKGGRLAITTANVVVAEEDVRDRPDIAPGRYVQLIVSDTGCGMDEGVLAHLFEPFFTTKEVGKGTGLGLATVYGIVKQSAGHIRAASTVGKGSRFTILFPPAEHLRPQAGQTARKAPGEEPEPPRGCETVLLVEDEAAVRNLIHHILQQKGYKVLVARNGEEALTLSQKHTGPVHLLLTDVVMPGMGGPELARRLLRDRSETRVLYMSGYTDRPLVEQEMPDLQPDVLLKPFSPIVLTKKVFDVLTAHPRQSS